ncbi:dihydropteroate synthase [Roseivirga pacifica]|uniref:dihydropteroate synthase n=1 Tax=Roseivirga pacifica TaxID=1267423 RepID=UPI0020944C85|nr:dihydropteroate synthase [Roseivirga pacifica]MCO6357858.1 dihydropteroate synthase [Roseivirga pacifica]MCO6366110.1 dihydropteroate synthase [Roseivirga pacifica]MCO6371438.1 dihydropteroate synthase [Roseivirga pacifica]MCO6375390.1 dihydropteroate synthase [Roseivirga pacifica]MCO6378816.1 dihydropteroate synthase [Roseivirga pacifica]
MTKSTLNVKGNLISLDSPLVMGILNINPDSFFSESRTQTPELIKAKAAKMLEDGASIIDIGGYSTRPGAAEVAESEETDRVILAVETILKEFPETVISVDTFRSAVAKAGIEAGATIINDVSGGLLDEEMFATVAKLRVPYILMHMRGTPQTMSNLTNYDNLLVDVCTELDAQLAKLKALGVADVVLDPGFGFAKTVEQNYEMLKNLSYFQRFNLPVLAGLSRKSMIYKTLGNSAEEALNGTTALNMAALINGAKILRVHDVKEATETVKLYNQLYA